MICVVCETEFNGKLEKIYCRCPMCDHETLNQLPKQTFIINTAIEDEIPRGNSGLEKFKRLTTLRSTDSREILIDLGCGNGIFPYLLKSEFKTSIGVEITPECIEFARNKLNLHVFESLEHLSTNPSVVTSWHSFEHFPPSELKRTLNWLQEHCSNNTVVIVSVPNAFSYLARLFGARSAYFDVPNHIYQFTPNSLDWLFKRYGFSRRSSIFSFPYLWFGYLQSFLNLFNRIHNYLYYRKKRNWKFNRSKIQLLASDFYNYALVGLLLPISILLTVIDWFFPERAGVITHIYSKS